MIIQCGILQPVKDWIKNKMIFYHISELFRDMIKHHFIFYPVQEQETTILQAVRCHIL